MISLEYAQSKYGYIEKGTWVYEERYMTTMGIPSDIAQDWINTATGRPTDKIYCNVDLVDPLFHALWAIRDKDLLGQLRTFGGCFNIRYVRGGTKISAHAYGLAIDINAGTNKLGEYGDLSDELARCFTDVGFIHGREFGRKDPMHFTLGW